MVGMSPRSHMRATDMGWWWPFGRTGEPGQVEDAGRAGWASAGSMAAEADVRSMMSLSSYYYVMQLVLNDVSGLPLRAYDSATREEVSDDPAIALLTAPNRVHTGRHLRAVVTRDAMLYGSGYILIGDDELIRIDPAAWSVTIAGDRYRMTSIDHRDEREVDVDSMIHIWSPMPVPLIDAAKTAVQRAASLQRHTANYYSVGARPSAVLVPPIGAKWSAEKTREITDVFMAACSRENRLSVVVLPDGVTYVPMSAAAEESQLAETQTQHQWEAAAYFGVPLQRLRGDLSEHVMTAYYTDAVFPWLLRWEDELNRKLASEDTKIEHVTQAILRAQHADRTAFYSTLARIGVLTPNEIRRWENLEPLDGGDEPLMQKQNVPMNQLGGNENVEE